MYNILKIDDFDGPVSRLSPFRRHQIEVMGLMDLPTFSIGRQNPCIGIWRHHCRGSAVNEDSGRGKVELVSGLPRSLLDIFSTIGEGATEQDFWDWPGAEGTFLQCQLWEAYRLAGMLALRRCGLHGQSVHPLETAGESRHFVLPKTAVLVSRILSNVDAIRSASAQPEHKDTLVINAINYPVLVSGLEIDVLKENTAWKDVIRSCFTPTDRRGRFNPERRLLLEILESLWELNDVTVDVNDLALAKGIELGLL